MGKVIYCNKVNPSSDCNHVIRGKDVEEVLQKAGVHAKEHFSFYCVFFYLGK